MTNQQLLAAGAVHGMRAGKEVGRQAGRQASGFATLW